MKENDPMKGLLLIYGIPAVLMALALIGILIKNYLL